MKVKRESEVAQLCPTLSNPMDRSLPGSSVHGIFPGKSTGVGCHCLLQYLWEVAKKGFGERGAFGLTHHTGLVGGLNGIDRPYYRIRYFLFFWALHGSSTLISWKKKKQPGWGSLKGCISVYVTIVGSILLDVFALYKHLHIHIGKLSTTIAIILFIHHATFLNNYLWIPFQVSRFVWNMFLGLDYNKSCFQKCILFTFLNYKTNICL